MRRDYKLLESECEEIIVEEGDILYHPAGIWHSVECVEDSISINFSLRSLRWSDLLGNVINLVHNFLDGSTNPLKKRIS